MVLCFALPSQGFSVQALFVEEICLGFRWHSWNAIPKSLAEGPLRPCLMEFPRKKTPWISSKKKLKAQNRINQIRKNQPLESDQFKCPANPVQKCILESHSHVTRSMSKLCVSSAWFVRVFAILFVCPSCRPSVCLSVRPSARHSVCKCQPDTYAKPAL